MLLKLPRTAAKIRPHIKRQEPITRGTPSPSYCPSCLGLKGALRCALNRVCHNHRRLCAVGSAELTIRIRSAGHGCRKPTILCSWRLRVIDASYAEPER